MQPERCPRPLQWGACACDREAAGSATDSEATDYRPGHTHIVARDKKSRVSFNQNSTRRQVRGSRVRFHAGSANTGPSSVKQTDQTGEAAGSGRSLPAPIIYLCLMTNAKVVCTLAFCHVYQAAFRGRVAAVPHTRLFVSISIPCNPFYSRPHTSHLTICPLLRIRVRKTGKSKIRSSFFLAIRQAVR